MPDLEAQDQAKDVCQKLSSGTEMSTLMLDTVIRVIHPYALGQARARNKDKKKQTRELLGISANRRKRGITAINVRSSKAEQETNKI